MKVKLLRKVRSRARWLINNKLYKFETTWGEVTGLSYSAEYRWAFDWMFGQRLNYSTDQSKIVSTVSRKAWKHGERDWWVAKLRKLKKGEVK